MKLATTPARKGCWVDPKVRREHLLLSTIETADEVPQILYEHIDVLRREQPLRLKDIRAQTDCLGHMFDLFRLRRSTTQQGLRT
jgi:hypothetical protein